MPCCNTALLLFKLNFHLCCCYEIDKKDSPVSMPPSVCAAIAEGVEIFLTYAFIVLCLPCLLGLVCVNGGGGKCGTQRANRHAYNKRVKPPQIPPIPPPLPTIRIDIRRLPVAEQPESCHLLKLPRELRDCIYEQVLGGRLISLQLVGSQYQAYCVVRSQCYLPGDDLSHGPTRGILPAKRISTTLLRSCRQVYTEALRILHQRNTFHFWASQMEEVVRCGLGYYCLPDIHSIYIFHDELPPFHARPRKIVCALLQQMNLTRVAFEFAAEPELAELDPYCAVRDSTWGVCVLGLRDLRRLELWFNDGPGDRPEHPVDRKVLLKRLKQLMMGPGADERYRVFLEEHKF
ncbi:hypothetical protein B0H19DRAFT_1139480 [Mycena capillaripes]|nr:hypothetical protein B0H19DRAFT_1139480 [Mycena capillaripes]